MIQIARGRAFTFAYTTLLIYLAVWFVLRSMGVPFFYESLSVWLGVLLSLGVFVGYSVFHDAYFRASDSPKYWASCLARGGGMILSGPAPSPALRATSPRGRGKGVAVPVLIIAIID